MPRVVVTDDVLLGVEHLADLQGDLRLLEGTGQVLDPFDNGADANRSLGIELAAQGIDDGTGQLLQILGFDARADFLNQRDIGLVDIDDKILVLVGEQVLHDVIGRDVRSGGNPDEEDNPVDIVVEAQLPRLSNRYRRAGYCPK